MRTSGWMAEVMVLLQSAVASRNRQGLAGDPCGVRRSEEDGGGGDVLRLPDAAQWRLRLDLFAQVAFGDAGGVDSFCLHHAGIDGVDPNAARPEFLGQRARQRI